MPDQNEIKQEVKESEGAAAKEPEAASVVQLSEEQYEALLDRIAELEALKARSSSEYEAVTDLDTLANEGKASRRLPETEEKEEVDLDSMSNSQLYQYVIGTGGEEVRQEVQKLAVAVEALKVLREIDYCTGKYSDFDAHRKEVQRISTINPTLTIEEAYLLAKSRSGGAKPSSSAPATTITERILKLPPRVTSGERPGVAPGSTKEGDQIKTLKDAASKAWDEIVGKGKETTT